MKREHVIDLYFMEARAKLIDLAAFLDRVDRAPGTEDFRMAAFRQALQELPVNKPDRAKRVLLSLSDPTTKPLPAATTKSAAGAWNADSAARDARQGDRDGRAPRKTKK
jgi:hypothetical protein